MIFNKFFNNFLIIFYFSLIVLNSFLGLDLYSFIYFICILSLIFYKMNIFINFIK